MKGTIRANGAGRWVLTVDIGKDPVTGRRQRQARAFTGTRRQAESKLAALVTAAAEGRESGSAASFGRLLDAWIEAAELAPSTRREYERLIERRIRPALGAHVARNLNAGTIDAFYRAQTASGLSAASVHQIHAIIHRALHQAVKWEWLTRNAAEAATPPAVRRTPVKPPTAALVRQLLEAAGADPDLGMAALLAAATGARRGELCALRWSDLHLGKGELTIARSITDVGGWAEKDTKTHAERTIPIGPATVAELERHREAMDKRAAAAGVARQQSGFVITRSVDGSAPWAPGNLSHRWRRLCAEQGVSVRLHDLRHWSVTTQLDAGVPVPVVAERHGHRDGIVTLTVYGHQVDARAREASDVVEEALR